MKQLIYSKKIFAALPLLLMAACATPNTTTNPENTDSGTSSATPTSDSPMATNEIRINSGGDTYTSSQGITWSEDFGFNSSSEVYQVSQPVEGTDDSALYQTERFGDEVVYDIPVENGSYTVNLHFAEGYWEQPNQRLMNISIEDQPVEERFDIVAEVGSAHTALVKTYTTNVTDEVLTVRLSAVETGQGYHATIQGLEITPGN